MKKIVFLVEASIIFISAAFAVPSLETELPSSYTSFRDSVYNGSSSESSITSLYNKAVSEAKLKYTSYDQLTLLAMCDYMRGMDYYYRDENEKAGDLYDSGIAFIKKSRAIKDTAVAITVYAKLLLQNAAVSSFLYQVKWVPKISGFCDDAIKLNPTYTPAVEMKYCILCYIPSPYGDYKEGTRKMPTLNDAQWKKDTEDYFTIAKATAYAFAEIDDDPKAILWYKKALEYYPGNPEVKKALANLQK